MPFRSTTSTPVHRPTRRCGGSVAALGARAAAGNAGDRIHQRPVAGGNRRANVAYWHILLQKSQNAERLIFRERTKQAAIADRCSLKRAAEVACEFVAGCSSPPHQYSIAAPTARRICAPCCKKTFATKSARSSHPIIGIRAAEIDPFPKFDERARDPHS